MHDFKGEVSMRIVVAFVMCTIAAPLASQTPRIEDNSFLIEEAYNQERGVVQHISTWQRSLTVSSWSFGFTQEWPLASQRHQVSYTLLVGHAERRNVMFDGALINYRYQLLPADGRVAISPRVSAVIPGDQQDIGVQLALPVSVRVSQAFVTHWDAGWTESVPTATVYSLGGSVVWLAGPTFNVLCEAQWTHQSGDNVLLLNPGVRWAYNFSNGLQIVPGMAFTYGLGPAEGVRAAFLYLSFEHPFGGGSNQN